MNYACWSIAHRQTTKSSQPARKDGFYFTKWSGGEVRRGSITEFASGYFRFLYFFGECKQAGIDEIDVGGGYFSIFITSIILCNIKQCSTCCSFVSSKNLLWTLKEKKRSIFCKATQSSKRYFNRPIGNPLTYDTLLIPDRNISNRAFFGVPCSALLQSYYTTFQQYNYCTTQGIPAFFRYKKKSK